MTVAILGGTFDPVHVGHLVLGQEVRAQFGYDTVLFVPSCIPAHKPAPEARPGGASADDRLHMLRSAVRGILGFAVEDCELRRGGVSYTVDTISHVLERYAPSRKPGLVLGDDLLDGFSTWHEPDSIAAGSDIIVAHRTRAEELPFAYPHAYCRNLLLPISSTVVRDRIRRRLPVRFLVPDAVLRHIESRGLYR